MPNTDEFESQAIITPITEIAISVTLATIICDVSLSLILKRPPIIFSLAAEEAARSWLSAVDIVLAKIPARIIPARSAGTTPTFERSVAI